MSDSLPTTSRDCYDDIDRMNGSTLVHGMKSMRALKRAIEFGYKSTPAMTFGTQYHALILEPEEFKRKYAVMPAFKRDPNNVDAKGNPSTNANTSWVKKRKAQFFSDCQTEGVEVIEQDDFDRALEMVESIYEHGFARDLIRGSQREVTVEGVISGVPMKGRIDLLQDGVIADVKGTQNAENEPFSNKMMNLNTLFKLSIHRELAQQQGARINRCYLIAVESSGHFETAVYEVPLIALDNALEDVVLTLDRYKRAKKTGKWPGIQGGMSNPPSLSIPDWAMGESDEDLVIGGAA